MDMGKSAVSSVTVASRRASSLRIARRVGSASAAKTVLRLSGASILAHHLTDKLNIRQPWGWVNGQGHSLRGPCASSCDQGCLDSSAALAHPRTAALARALVAALAQTNPEHKMPGCRERVISTPISATTTLAVSSEMPGIVFNRRLFPFTWRHANAAPQLDEQVY